MADFHFSKAQSFEDLVAVHDRFVAEYNTQKHFAHEDRKDGKRSPQEVLGWLTTVRHLPEELERAFFTIRFTRTLDSSGYARIKHWKVYGEEGLPRCEVALWLGERSLVVEFAGEDLARYEVAYSPRVGRLREVKSALLFVTRYRHAPQLKLFELDALGESGWLKALRLDEYAPRIPRRPQEALQEGLFAERSSEAI